MQKFFVTKNQIDFDNNKITIVGDDVNHIKNVLRLTIGEKIEICEKSENPSKYICKIENLSSKQIECLIINKCEDNNESNIKIHIFQGVPKAEKMELIIQKCTELGVCEFIPVEMSRCAFKLNSKDITKKVERWNKIAEVASKQCGRDIIPNVRNRIYVKELALELSKYDYAFVAYENETKNFLKNELERIENTKKDLKIAIIIGPEGGIAEEEINILKQEGAKIISLGKRILRTETVRNSIIWNNYV